MQTSAVSHNVPIRTSKILFACTVSLAMVMAGCSNGSGTSSSSNTISSLTGSVSAPGGALAFNPPGKLEQLFASIFGKAAYADITGVSKVGSGVKIELIEVDSSGNKIGSTLASTTTGSDGSYTLTPPSNFTAASKYVIRASGTSQTQDVRVVAAGNDVDPISDAVSKLVASQITDLSKVSTDEIGTITDAVTSVAQGVDPTNLSASALSTALQTAAKNEEEVLNQITSTAAGGQICGNVKDASGTNLQNIVIMAMDYGNWVKRSQIKTDSSGNYCLNVPTGKDYILGAMNYTGTSTAASEWWSTSGNHYNQWDGEKITVADTTKVSKDFSLEAGMRISGTVKTTGAGSLTAGTALEGVQVTVRTYQDAFPVVHKLTAADGTYRINVFPGTYQIEAVNRTRQAYASEMYDGSTGTSYRFKVSKLVYTTAGATQTVNFDLVKGYKAYGQVLDNSGGSAVTGTRVLIDIDSSTEGNSPSFRLRTNNEGKYGIWLMPDKYFISTYGQTTTSQDMTAANANKDFSSQVGMVTATIKDAAGSAISQAKVYLTDTSGNNVSQEISSSDGTVTLYSPTTGNHLAYVRIDSDHGSDTTANKRYGSVVYDGTTTPTQKVLLSGTNIGMTVGSTVAAGTLTLPDAGVLKVSVTTDGTTPVANYRAQVRDSGGTGIFFTHRTLSDGSYILSLPAGTYVVRMIDATTNCTSVNITAGATTTVNFNTTTKVCS